MPGQDCALTLSSKASYIPQFRAMLEKQPNGTTLKAAHRGTVQLLIAAPPGLAKLTSNLHLNIYF